ncbi:hypothetical protein TGARI_370860 [Toxoplasma gondii ARI]|uniref:Uncharacterized protein n=1 Tax=Toxoplasma gondii ARI TaxID=1074872 RepID=A0A139XSF6_TOXGO|nr:hypothetical protein TGARI_370860 [Toxoplasma gondii ARI]
MCFRGSFRSGALQSLLRTRKFHRRSFSAMSSLRSIYRRRQQLAAFRSRLLGQRTPNPNRCSICKTGEFFFHFFKGNGSDPRCFSVRLCCRVWINSLSGTRRLPFTKWFTEVAVSSVQPAS